MVSIGSFPTRKSFESQNMKLFLYKPLLTSINNGSVFTEVEIVIIVRLLWEWESKPPERLLRRAVSVQFLA